MVYNVDETDIEEDKSMLLHSLNRKSISEFNQWFNDMFEKVKVTDDESDTGYNAWIENNEVGECEKVALRDFGKAFEAKKVPEGFNYDSGSNNKWETVDSLKSLIKEHVDSNFN